MTRTMKDSGIEWIGEIPENWNIARIAHIYDKRESKVSDEEFPPLSVTKQGIVPQLNTAAKSDAHDDRKLLCIGDFAINSRSDRRGSCGISAYNGSISLINIVLMPKTKMNPKYYDWLFHTTLFADEFYKWGHGIVNDLWTTNWQDMKKIIVPIPDLIEQQKIAEFLDTKCSHIDFVLDKTKASIEEYKKLKQAVITQAVTKGIRPNRPMKDSGIEWIGEIPEGWGISKIKFVSHFNPQYTIVPHDGDVVTFAPMDCIKNGYYINKESVYNKANTSYTPFQEGDIVMAKVTPCFENGNIAIMAGLSSGYGYGSSELFVLRPKNINTKFLFYYLQNQMFKKFACSTMTGTGGLKRVSPVFVQNCSITIPIKTEQQEIADYLDIKCAEIDKLIKKKEQLISELETYKKSLIYEYVTGKKEVC